MKSYDVSRHIDAEPTAVWAVLVDTAAYPTWDSGVLGVDGTPTPGAKLTVRSEVAPDRTFPVTVSTLEAPSCMVWRSGMPLGLFRGVRTFSLAPAPGGGTTFRMREEFSGPLLGLIWRSMPDLQPSFDRFADGLRAAATDR